MLDFANTMKGVNFNIQKEFAQNPLAGVEAVQNDIQDHVGTSSLKDIADSVRYANTHTLLSVSLVRTLSFCLIKKIKRLKES